MAQRPEFGLILDDPRSLSLGRASDPVGFVALRSCLSNMPRAAGARGLAQRAREAHPDAEFALYGWHYLTHIKRDGLAARANRKLQGSEFGHLRDTPAVQQAWEVTQTALEAAGSKRVVIRTPSSFSTGQVSRDRLKAFAAARAAEGIGVLWAPEGLWTDSEAVAVAADAGVEVLLSVRYDRIEPELEAAWLRIDGELRPSSADQLAYTLEAFETMPPVMFAGPRAHANLRNFAAALG